MSSSETHYLTPTQVAERLELSLKTTRRRIADGTIPATRIGRLVRINEADLAALGSPIGTTGGDA